jgi:hypothetical protein
MSTTSDVVHIATTEVRRTKKCAVSSEAAAGRQLIASALPPELMPYWLPVRQSLCYTISTRCSHFSSCADRCPDTPP